MIIIFEQSGIMLGGAILLLGYVLVIADGYNRIVLYNKKRRNNFVATTILADAVLFQK